MPFLDQRRYQMIVALLLFALCFFCAVSLQAQNQEKKSSSSTTETMRAQIEPTEPYEGEMEATADDVEFLREENKLIGRGNVLITQKDVRLLADQAEIFTDTKKAYAEGHVTVKRGNTSISGDKVFYDFRNHQGSFPKGRIVNPPLYVQGEQIEQVSKNQINVYGATVTTCPIPHTHYDMKAPRAVVYPGDKVVAWNVTYRVLGFPVFWWPYMVFPLDQETGPFELQVGQSKDFGNYAFFGKTFPIIPPADGREVTTKVHVNYYSHRGWAVGNQTWYHLNKIGDGMVKLFDIKDERAPDPFVFKEDDAWREKERYRVTWKHRTDFDPYTNLILQYNGLSDPYLMNTFFETEYDDEPVPQTFAIFTRNAVNYGLVVDFEVQANNFDNVLQKLPEVRFTWNDTEIKNTGLYYDNETSYVNFNNVSHTETADPEDGEGKRKIVTENRSHASRVDTFHEFSYPKRFFRFYDLTPRVNTRWTYYNHNASGEDNEVRNVSGLGGELATRFYRFFDIPKGKILGIKADRIRHWVKPTINYDAARHVSTKPGHLQQFDGIDGIDVSDVVKLGLENRLQTKSGGARIDIVSLNTYAYYEFNNPNNDTRFTTGNVELILRPYSWLIGRTQIDIDLKQHRRTASDSDLVLNTKYLELKLNHRYVFTTKESLESDPYYVRETNVLTWDGTIRLNERWKMGGYVRWEVKRHSFREYEWRITRDLHDWEINFGQNIQHTDVNWLNHELFLEIQLKAFPGVMFGTGSRAEFADARIGETVSGSNVAPPPKSLLQS